jgi:hypothetical protein
MSGERPSLASGFLICSGLDEWMNNCMKTRRLTRPDFAIAVMSRLIVAASLFDNEDPGKLRAQFIK